MRWLAGFSPTKAIYTCRWSERCSAHCGRATLRRPDRWKTEEKYMALTGVLRPGHVALRVLAGDLEKSGLATDMSWVAAGEHPATGERFRFTVPTGHTMELYAHKDILGCLNGYKNPDPWPDGLHGMAPSRFDHCLLYGDDLDGTVKLFREVLGFGLAEQVIAGPEKLIIAAFLSCSNK